jgi:TolA-binding protein
MSLNPRSYQTYVAAASSGSVGNIYQRVDPGSIDHSGSLDQTQQYLSEMDSSVNSLGGAATNQNAQIQVAQVKQAANSVIKKLTDIREERESTAAEREKVKRKIQTMGGPVSEWKTTVLQIITITLAAVLLTYFVFSFVLPPVVNMSIAIAGMLVGVGYAIYFSVTKQ